VTGGSQLVLCDPTLHVWTVQANPGGGSGTVTSVSGPAWLTWANPTTAAVATVASQTANYFLAAPNGSAGAATFRAMVAADVPTLNQNTTGTAANLSGTPALPNGTTATTQATSDNTTKLATDAFVNSYFGAQAPLTAGTNVTFTGTWPNITINASGGGGPGTINAATQYYLPYYSAAGSATTISGAAVVGIVKGQSAAAPTAAAAADIYNLFTSCTGSSGLFLEDGGTCAAPSGSIFGLTTGYFPKAASSTTIANSNCDEGITTANTLTCTDSAGIAAPAFKGTGSNPYVNFPSNPTHTGAAGDFWNNAGVLQFGATPLNVIVSSGNPSAGVLHVVGSTQTATGSPVSLTADVSGILPLANGGTNCAAPFPILPKTATYQVLLADFTCHTTITVASGTFTITLVASGGMPAAGTSIQILNYGSGVVTVAASGQNINGVGTSQTLAAGSASAPTGIDITTDATNYFAQPLASSSGGGQTTPNSNYWVGWPLGHQYAADNANVNSGLQPDGFVFTPSEPETIGSISALCLNGTASTGKEIIGLYTLAGTTATKVAEGGAAACTVNLTYEHITWSGGGTQSLTQGTTYALIFCETDSTVNFAAVNLNDMYGVTGGTTFYADSTGNNPGTFYLATNCNFSNSAGSIMPSTGTVTLSNLNAVPIVAFRKN